jgi:GIY-YIG catalytic domain
MGCIMIDITSIVPTALPSVVFTARQTLPCCSCVYFALSAEGAVLYVGQSQNLRERWYSHHRTEELRMLGCVSIAWYVAPVEDGPDLENALIQHYQPALNGWKDRPVPRPSFPIKAWRETAYLLNLLVAYSGESRGALIHRLAQEECKRLSLSFSERNSGDLPIQHNPHHTRKD